MPDAVWWKSGIIYQVYPRSFQDSNEDGVGDLPGIIRRLDYLEQLGVDAIWISPIYPSPMADFGYDISDYCGIDPVFGSLADFDRLIDEAHRRAIRVILDFVPNHTSNQHPWFVDSRRSRESSKRDWYIWRDASAGGGPPNNWLSNFGGSAWAWDDATGQYYYHAFLKAQPDLNWRNPDVRAAMHAVMRFWLDRGVDGFRVDVIWHLMKDEALRDNPPNPGYVPGQPEINRLLQVNSADQPDIADVVGELRRVVDAYPDRILIGEVYLPIQRLVAYYGQDLMGVQLPFNFQLLQTAWDADAIAALIDEYEQSLPEGAWPNWVLGNHDQRRVATRVGPAQARVAAMLLLTLRGTPTLYYGDEIGMTDVPIPADAAQDPWEKNEPGLGFGRDPQRTPMQWDDSANAGFSPCRPWLPVGADYRTCNVAGETHDPASMLGLQRRLIALRRRMPALTLGTYRRFDAGAGILGDERCQGTQRLLVVLNLRHDARTVALPDWTTDGVISVSTDPARTGAVSKPFLLAADEGVLIGRDPAVRPSIPSHAGAS